MKNLIRTANSSSPPIAEYDRVIYNPITDNVVVMGGAYVDLGLPSHLKWAKYNIGATTETEDGVYFQWGETSGVSGSLIGKYSKENYSCETYKYYNGTENTMTEYNTSDGKTTLDPVDDAAAHIMGGNWRMPTKDDFQELITYTDNEWINDFDGNGTKGYKFTSKKDTSNYIFIPASDYHEDISTYIIDISYGVWSSSLDADYPDSAYGLYFSSTSVKEKGGYDRCDGYVVRGVCKS